MSEHVPGCQAGKVGIKPNPTCRRQTLDKLVIAKHPVFTPSFTLPRVKFVPDFRESITSEQSYKKGSNLETVKLEAQRGPENE